MSFHSTKEKVHHERWKTATTKRKKYKERKKNPNLSLGRGRVFFANRQGDGRINSLLHLGHGLRLSWLRLLCLKNGFLAFAFILWSGSAMASLLTFGHFHHATLVTNLARPFSGLGRGKQGLGGRRLLNRS